MLIILNGTDQKLMFITFATQTASYTNAHLNSKKSLKVRRHVLWRKCKDFSSTRRPTVVVVCRNQPVHLFTNTYTKKYFER